MIAARNMSVSRLTPPEARVLGLPVGRFGPFAICLLSWALGLIAFCISCFVSIVSLLFYNVLGHHSVDFADTYRYVAFPIGLSVTVISFFVLVALWMRRKVRGM